MRARHPSLYDDAFGTDPDYWRHASPTLQLTRNARPILLVCSSERADSCAQAHGFMVNYQYDLDDIERNHETYAESRTVVASGAVQRLLRSTEAVPVAG